MRTEKVELTELIANEGKLIARKEDGLIMGEKIYLGIHDKKSNYKEVDKPIIETEAALAETEMSSDKEEPLEPMEITDDTDKAAEE